MRHVIFRNFVAALALSAALTAASAAHAANWSGSYNGDDGMTPAPQSSDMSDARSLPALTTTNDPAPAVIYRRGSADTVLAGNGPMQRSGKEIPYYHRHVETQVTHKVASLNKDLNELQNDTGAFQSRLEALQQRSDADAASYYELVAAINTELQSGTTPGNPVLVERWNNAQNKLDSLSNSAGLLNGLAADLAAEASKGAFLQDSIRATYGLSGAVKEDHDNLRRLEDNTNQQIVNLNRLLTSVNDEINRRSAYLRSERANLQTLSLSISNGELYGQNISNSLYTRATQDAATTFRPNPAPANRRPLVIIRFDRSNVNYEQPLYTAVSQALDKYPNARFDLVAVSTSRGNPAEMALASSEARKNGESVLRSLSAMGLPVERVRLNAANSPDVRNSEVHIYLQ